MTQEDSSKPESCNEEGFMFEKYLIRKDCVIFETEFAFATLSHKPAIPGHALVIPRRIEAAYDQLNPKELFDLSRLCSRVARALRTVYPEAHAIRTSCQDGAAAGQTVRHVHLHVVPWIGSDEVLDDDCRVQLTDEEMAMQCSNLRRTEAEE